MYINHSMIEWDDVLTSLLHAQGNPFTIAIYPHAPLYKLTMGKGPVACVW